MGQNLPEANFSQIHHISVIMLPICSEVKVIQDQRAKTQRLHAKKKKKKNPVIDFTTGFTVRSRVFTLFNSF